MARGPDTESTLRAWRELGASGWDFDGQQRRFHDELLYPALRREIAAAGAARVLDFGAGTGGLAPHVANVGVDYEAYEPVREFATRAAQRPAARRSFTTLDSADPPYDCVVLNLVLSAVHDGASLLREAVSLLGRRGVLLCTVPHPVFSLLQRYHTTTKRRWHGVDHLPELHGLGRYIERAWEEVIWKPGGPATMLVNRTFGDYFDLFAGAGLKVVKLLEPTMNAGDDSTAPPAWHWAVLPPFSIWVLMPSRRRDSKPALKGS